MKQNLCPGHCRQPIQFRVATITTDDQCAEDPVDFEQRDFIAAAAVALFVAAGHVNLGVFVHDLAAGIDHVREVEVAVSSFPECAGNDPDAGFAGCLAGAFEGRSHGSRILLDDVGEIIAREGGLGKQHHATAFSGSAANVMQGSLKISFDGFGPMQLDARDLKGFTHGEGILTAKYAKYAKYAKKRAAIRHRRHGFVVRLPI